MVCGGYHSVFCFEPFYGQSCAEPTPQARSATRFSSPSKEKPTQFFLKQPWEQKKLSFMPNPKQVGHCKASALLSQSTPRHFLLGGSSDVTSLMVECSGQVDGGEGRKWIALLPFCWSEAVPAHRRVRLSQNQPRPAQGIRTQQKRHFVV